MSLLFYVIYFGGVFGSPDKKIGFWNRTLWPAKLGAALMRDIHNRPDYDKLED